MSLNKGFGQTIAALLLLFSSVAPATCGQWFDIASVKPSDPRSGLSCSGGPGIASLGLWRCTNMPLSLLISKAFAFQVFEFNPKDPCCQARFDFDVRFPAGTSKDQFDLMLQNLLRERFRLAFHHEHRAMAVYGLTPGLKGPNLTQSPPGTARQSDGPWWVNNSLVESVGKDGYPVFAPGREGLANGLPGYERWVAFNISTKDIAKALSEQLARPVLDATGFQGLYDVDLKWIVDLNWLLSERQKSQYEEEAGKLPDYSGPTLIRAVQDQLGLRLVSKKGAVEIVVIDHFEKVPTGN